MSRTTIYTSFNDPTYAEKAAGALLDHGVQQEDLSIIQSHRPAERAAEDLMPNEIPSTMYVVPNVGGPTTGLSPMGVAPMVAINENEDANHHHYVEPRALEEQAKQGISTTTVEDAESGAIAGTAWGGGIGLAAVLATMFIPGVGLVIGGGALAAGLLAIAATAGAGAVAGAVTGYLVDQGVDASVAEVYDNAITTGGAVLALTLPSGDLDEAQAWEILDKYGAQNATTRVGSHYLA